MPKRIPFTRDADKSTSCRKEVYVSGKYFLISWGKKKGKMRQWYIKKDSFKSQPIHRLNGYLRTRDAIAIAEAKLYPSRIDLLFGL
jgi:hypothetical protein